MGFLSFLKRAFGVQPPSGRVLVCGLDGVGKSSILSFMKSDPKDNVVVPTVGYSLEEFSFNGFSFTVFDMSGQSRYRDLWEHYIKESQAIIYVIDATDKLRLVVAKDELANILQHPDLKNVPFLLLANKMDLQEALAPSVIVTEMNLSQLLSSRNWHINGTCALDGDGLDSGFSWLADQLRS
ncbi:hypothetical protein P9112_012198 [Eukaryota sp. TZLM1-RC]